LEFFLNDAPDLVFGGIGAQVAVKAEEAARDETGKPCGESGDGVDDLPDGTSRRRVDDGAGMVEGEVVETLDHLADKAAARGGSEVPGQGEELVLEGDGDHGWFGIEVLRE